jgi:hypothetical protein
MTRTNSTGATELEPATSGVMGHFHGGHATMAAQSLCSVHAVLFMRFPVVSESDAAWLSRLNGRFS